MAVADLADVSVPKTEIGHGQNGIVPWNSLVDTIERVPELQWPRSIDIYDQMRSDSQIEALWRALTMPILRYNWVINPNGAKAKVYNAVAKDLNLPIKGRKTKKKGRQRGRFNHGDHLRHALLGCVYGHMFFNQVAVWDDAEDRYVLKKLAPRMPKTISEIGVADDGGLEYIKQFPIGKTIQANGQSYRQGFGEAPKINVNELVAYVYEREGANWFGRSFLRTAYKNWLLKDRLLRVDALKHERNGMGIPEIEAPPGAGDDIIEALAKKAALIRAGGYNGGASPNGSKLRLVGVEGTIPDTLASIRYHDEQMARMLLAMFLQLGQTQSGSRALGEVQTDYFALAQEAVAIWYRDITNEHVIEDIVDWNWGPEEQAPLLEFERVEEPALSIADLATAIEKGLVVVDEELEAWFRERHRLPEKADVEPEDATSANSGTGTTESGTPAGSSIATQSNTAVTASRRKRSRKTKAATSGEDPDEESGADFDSMQDDWEAMVAALLLLWANDVRPTLVDTAVSAIEQFVDAGDLEGLSALEIDPYSLGEELIRPALDEAVRNGVQHAVSEAASQGVDVTWSTADSVAEALADQMDERAAVANRLLTRGLAEAAARKASLVAGPDSTGADVAEATREHLLSLSDAWVRDMLGGALTQSVNSGRKAVFATATVPLTLYASETLDSNTCKPCKGVHKRKYASIDEAEVDYPIGGYAQCEGGNRCRGTLLAVYSEA